MVEDSNRKFALATSAYTKRLQVTDVIDGEPNEGSEDVPEVQVADDLEDDDV